MAMNVGPASGDDEPMIEMNMTPLIDVMLVLLIMFIITIPIQTHAVKMNLPVAPSAPPPQPPQIVRIDVDFDGSIGWNGTMLADRHELDGARPLAGDHGIPSVGGDGETARLRLGVGKVEHGAGDAVVGDPQRRQGAFAPFARQDETPAAGERDVGAPDEVLGRGIRAETAVPQAPVGRVGDCRASRREGPGRRVTGVGEHLAGELGDDVDMGAGLVDDQMARAAAGRGGDGGRVERRESSVVAEEVLREEVLAERDDIEMGCAGRDGVGVAPGDLGDRVADPALPVEDPGGRLAGVVCRASEDTPAVRERQVVVSGPVDVSEPGEGAGRAVEAEGVDALVVAVRGPLGRGIHEVAVLVDNEGRAAPADRGGGQRLEALTGGVEREGRDRGIGGIGNEDEVGSHEVTVPIGPDPSTGVTGERAGCGRHTG